MHNLNIKRFIYQGCPGGSEGKESTCNEGDPDLIPVLGRSPGEGNGYHFSILAYRIPWTEEPGGLQWALRIVPLPLFKYQKVYIL